MGSRTRTQNKYSGTGLKYNLQNVLVSSVSNLGSHDSITDFVADGDGHNLDVRHLTVHGLTLDYQTTGSISGRKWINWQLDRVRNPDDSMYGHLIVPGQPSDAFLAADLLARTNPSRPVVDLANFVYELREIPILLKKEGDNIVRNHHSNNLAYEFGIKPLISDLKKLVNFTDEVAKRTRELEQLAKGGLRRKRDLWSGSIHTLVPFDIIAQSGDKVTVHLDVHKNTQRRIWGFVVWYPDNPKGLMKSDLRDMARHAVLGLNLSFETAWNAIPWTWLIDWCSNVGDVLAANRNVIGATHGAIQLMTQTTTSALAKQPVPNSPVKDGGWTEVSKRRRTVTYVPVDFQLSLLSQRQLSILGSIGVTRRVPRNL